MIRQLSLFSLLLIIASEINGSVLPKNSTRAVSTWIESPRVLNFGDMGPEEVCPDGTFVFGFRLKVQLDQGIFIDDTALNSIELSCIDWLSKEEVSTVEVQLPKARSYIKSAEGRRGSWGGYFECFVGPSPRFATGFELRSEELTLDNTAANNFALMCDNGDGTNRRLEGNGLGWGEWTGLTMCPAGLLVCGIRAQVAIDLPNAIDDTALNNVDLACCEHP